VRSAKACGAALLVVGALMVASASAAPPRCWGAAARDPRMQPCVNPSLRHSVVPSPREARGRRNAPCTFIEQSDEVRVCEFGQREGEPARMIALLGDSHASHWRAALEVAAAAKHWRGLSITQTSCPFSKAFRILVERERSTACVRWKREIFPWFRRHPEVRTVFAAGLSGSGVVPRRGQSEFATAVAGYVAAWKALPASVERIVVIRDTPVTSHEALACVERAIARRRPVGRACAVPRALALHSDPAVAAAARMHSRRVRVMDLSRYFCDSRLCFPVIGGVLVYKDITHITTVFAETLGQFMLRRLGG
jgi:SGNH domain (fused to AT3 domains)